MEKKFVSLDSNDLFTHFRGVDLQELIVQIENYFLEYRDKLDLPNYLTFGVELEYENVLRKTVNSYVAINLHNWKSKGDGSLAFGGEVTSPIMTDQKKYWQELKKICEFLSKKKADTMHNAGGHIHLGVYILGNDVEAWRQFIKLYMIYESVIFRFIYGDKISGRKKLYKYAPPISDKLYSYLSQINQAKDIIEIRYSLPTNDRYYALNFCNVNFYDPKTSTNKNTLEFRSPNASTNAVIWQNNINTFAKMLMASKAKVMDEEFLDYKLKNEYFTYSGNEQLYNNIYLKNALEFSDLVFDNNLDKIYFLRQYLKDFQDNYGIKTAVKAKRFIK